MEEKKAAAEEAEKATKEAETAIQQRKDEAAKLAKSLTDGELTKAAKAHVSGIEKDRLHKLAARMDGSNIWNFGLPSRGSKIGAHHVHDGTKEKSDEEKALDVLKKALKKEEASHAPDAAQSAPAHTPTPAAAPAASAAKPAAAADHGHDAHAGGH